MRRACLASAHSSHGHLQAISEDEYLPQQRYEEASSYRKPCKWPRTVALPLRPISFWGRYITGSAFLVLLVYSVVFGNELDQRRQSLDFELRSSDEFLGYDVGRALSSNSSGSSSSSSSLHGSSRCGGGHHTAEHTLNSTLAFLFFTFVVCTIIYQCNMYVPFEWRFPISVVMFILGGLIGMFFLYVTDGDSGHKGNGFDTMIEGLQGAAAMDPHALLYIILPPLLYESASSMDWHVLRKLLPSSILLAVPGVMLNTFLTGCFVKLFVTIGDHAPKWEESWLLGSILSATDPVAVVAALAELGAPKKLSSLVEGESLLNDGSAVVCAYVFMDWSSPLDPHKFCEGENGPGTRPRAICVMGYFVQVAVGGTALGIGAGIILYYWLRYVRNLHMSIIEIGVVFTAVYGTFYVAEILKTSGVLATVALGFVMAAGGLHRMSHDGRHNHHVVLSQVAFFCNEVAFFVAGIVSSRFMYSEHDSCDHSAASIQAWLELFGLYIVIHVTRAAVVFSFWPLLKRWGYGINWKEACIMVYGGLRGAVGLVMGLIVEHHKYINPDVAQMIAFHTSGIVLLTLFVNGSTIDGLYRRLDMYPRNQYRMTHLRKSLLKFEEVCQKKGIKAIAQDWYFHDCNLKTIVRCVPNFTYIRFNEADSPFASNLDSVKATLDSLATDAAKSSHSKVSTAEGGGFAEKWRLRKTDFDIKITELMNSASHMAERKDVMRHVVNSGDNRLAYRPPETKAQAGFYVSSRSIIKVHEDAEAEKLEKGMVQEHASIDMEITKADGVVVIFGLIASDEELSCCSPIEDQVVGSSCEDSIGFNCYTCEVLFNGPTGSGFIQTQNDPLQPGDTVTLSFDRQPGADWEVVFKVTGGGDTEPKLVVSVPFGPFQPSELYPVIEFRHSEKSKMLVADLSRRNTKSNPSLSKSGLAGDNAFGLPGPVAVGEALAEVSNKVDSSGKAALNIAKKGLESVAGLFVGTAKTGEEGEELGRVNCEGKCGCTVQLSFEPMLASDAESINELFHVLFNTVMHEYTEMHEHGIIGDRSLAWLSEALGTGLDCANREVNASRLNSFKAIREAKDNSNGSVQRQISNRFASEGMDKIKAVFAKMRMDTMKARLVGLFEPLIVEYLCLENMVATPSYWDSMCSSRLKLLGFHTTRTKVESLWAFIKAHEEVLHESATMHRFPDLVNCITTLVNMAKEDLKSLEELQPRRYYYSKHILALRVIMNKRLTKLEKFAKSGCISTSDSGALIDQLYERIVQADQFFPTFRLASRGSEIVAQGKSHLSMSLTGGMLSESVGDNVNAWEDVSLPQQTPKSLETIGTKGEGLTAIQITPSGVLTSEDPGPTPLNASSRSRSKNHVVVRVKNRHESKCGLRSISSNVMEKPMDFDTRTERQASEESEVKETAMTLISPMTPAAKSTTMLAVESVHSTSEGAVDPKVQTPLSVVPTSSAPNPPGIVELEGEGDQLDTVLNKAEIKD